MSEQRDVMARPVRTPIQESWHLLNKNRMAMSGMLMFAAFFVVALAGVAVTMGEKPILDPYTVRLADKLMPPLTRYNPDEVSEDHAPMFGVYLLGTDSLGRDVFARMLQGAWVSLTIGFVAVGISVIIGVTMGGMAGYFGGWVDTIVMRLVDIMLCFPTFFLILTVIALWKSSIFAIMVVIGLTSWMGSARFVRAEFLSLREQDFATAARALGVSDMRIIFRHMLPNAIAPVLISATIGIAGTILMESGLSFLGFGVPPPHATWGKVLADGRNFLFDAPWLTYVPGSAILVVVLAFNLFGEGLRDAFNPKLRERT